MGIVAVQKLEPGKENVKEKVYKTVRKAMENAKWKRFIHKGEDTLLKVNMCWADFLLPGMCTSPWVLGATIEVIQNYVGKIYIGEGMAAAFQSWKRGCKVNKWDIIAKEYNAELIDLSKDKYIQVKVKGVPFKITLSKFAVEIPNFITMPLMKTHSVTIFTGALKNQFGVTFGKRILYHLHLPQVIVGVNEIVRPNFAVMDGTIGMEGNGPANGIPKIMDLILASGDLPGLDSTACRIMGIDPKEVEHVPLAVKRKLGSFNPKIVGEKIENVKQEFKRAGPQAYYEYGMLPLLKSRFKDFVYNYLWVPGRFGVKILRDFWYLREGRKYKNKIIKSSRYGQQWV